MCELTTIAIVASAAMTATAQYQQGQVAKQTGRYNATMAEYAAQDSLRRGELEAQDIQRKGAALKSAQRTRLAAAGVDLGVGTADSITEQTDFFTAGDAATARFNASRDAWSSRAQGSLARFQGNTAARQANLQAASTLLTAGGKVDPKWFKTGP